MQAYVEYFQTHGQEYVHMIWQHLYLSLLAVGIAAAVGIPCGILSLRAPRIKKILTTGFSVLRIIPSLAVLVILIPIMGVGVKPALTALVILAIPPILIQTTLAFSQVPDFLLEVADAMGMDKKRKFRQVEVPLAMPGIISGIRRAGNSDFQRNQSAENRVSGDRWRNSGCHYYAVQHGTWGS